MTFELSSLLLILFGFGLCAATVGLILTSSLLKSIILLSSSSLMICLCYLCMDAPDVAMTEAAIGACLSTVIMLGFARKIKDDAMQGSSIRVAPFLLCMILTFVLIHAGLDLGVYGDVATQVHQHINRHFLENTSKEIGIPSFVAAILASYRGYDTLGETTVIFTAALAVAMVLGRRKDVK